MSSRKGLKCLTCDTTIVSRSRHDFVSCKCGLDAPTGIFVDGGGDYFRYGWGSEALYEEVDVELG